MNRCLFLLGLCVLLSTCAADPTCRDGVQNQEETDIDCGGACAACRDGRRCATAGDCASGVCTGGLCQARTCADGVRNGAESDIDCGGTCSSPCADGKGCGAAGDCAGGMCMQGRCLTPSSGCTDGRKDGAESDIDCGGFCERKCADGQGCQADDDCTGSACSRGQCVSLPAITSVSPTKGPSTGGIKVTLVGQGFQQGLSVMIDGRAATGVRRKSGTEVEVVLPQALGKLGKVDVVVANPNGRQGTAAQAFSYFYGQLTFAPRISYATLDGTNEVVTADLDGDGKLDLALSSYGGNSASVLIGNGDGTFRPRVDYPTPGWTSHIAAADVNGDGRPELAVASRDGLNISVLINKGDGTFRPRVDYPIGASTWWVAFADVNGDSMLDLLSANGGNTNDISVLLGNGDGTFRARTNFAGCGGSWSLAVADFNGDRKLDVVVSNYIANDGPGNFCVLLGTGTGTFLAPRTYTASMGPRAITAGDLDGDGVLDLVIGHGNRNLDKLSWLRGVGDGTFLAPGSVSFVSDGDPGRSPYYVALADMNLDGGLDLVSGLNWYGKASVVLGDRQGGFAAPALFAGDTDGPHGVVVGDFNRDGKPDFAMASFANKVSVYLNTSQ